MSILTKKRKKNRIIMKKNNNLHQELKSKEKVAVDNFEYKSFSEISKEFQNCKDVFAKLDYAKQLKKDAYDYVLDLDLDKLIRRLHNEIVINY
jgi:hypothetical protein